MATKHPLRRSCAFCRARKIKCSNETICEACRRQGADCIYDFEPLRPRTRTSSHDGVSKRSIDHRRRRSSSGGSAHSRSPSIVSINQPESLQDIATDTVASALENLFQENFMGIAKADDNLYGGHSSGITIQLSPSPVRQTSILTLLLQDIIGLVAAQHGSLGSYYVEQGRSQFFSSNLAKDRSQTMSIKSNHIDGSPLDQYGRRQQTQLIDIWYSTHPLSFLVSKTLLLRELRDGTHDKSLLAIMLADAHISMGDSTSIERGNALLRWAVSQLGTRPLQPSPLSTNDSGVPTAASTRVFHGISTVQALALLSWNALCSSQTRRAICYYSLANKLALVIHEQMLEVAGPLNSSRINGIDVFQVEKEIITHIYWVTQSIGLWAFLSTKNAQFLPATSSSPITIPATETTSAIIQLDLISDNFSTLQRQRAAIKEMRPLAHIVSVASFITSPNTKGLQARAWPFLLEKMDLLERQAAEAPSKILVSIVYNTLALHLLFPFTFPDPSQKESMDSKAYQFFSLAEGVIQAASALVDHDQSIFASLFPDVICLALDASSRALNSIEWVSTSQAAGPEEMHWGQQYDPRLEFLASQLFELSQSDWLNHGTSIRVIRKHIKAGLRTLGLPAGSGSSTPSSSSTLMGQSSVTHTPICSSPLPPPPSELRRHSAPDPRVFASAIPTILPNAAPMSSPFGMQPEADYFDASFNHLSKPNGQLVDLIFRDNLGPQGDFSTAQMTDLQDIWYPQMNPMMDFDMAMSLSISEEHHDGLRSRETMQAAQILEIGVDAGAWNMV